MYLPFFLQPNANLTTTAHMIRHAQTRLALTRAGMDPLSAVIMQSVTPKIIVLTAHAQPVPKETHSLRASLASASTTRTVVMMRLATGSTEYADQFAMTMTVLLPLSVKENNINLFAPVHQVRPETLTLSVPFWQTRQSACMMSIAPLN